MSDSPRCGVQVLTTDFDFAMASPGQDGKCKLYPDHAGGHDVRERPEYAVTVVDTEGNIESIDPVISIKVFNGFHEYEIPLKPGLIRLELKEMD